MGFDQICSATDRSLLSPEIHDENTRSHVQISSGKKVLFNEEIQCHVWAEGFPRQQVTIPATHDTLQSWHDKPWALRLEAEAPDVHLYDEFSAMQRRSQDAAFHAIVSNPSTPIRDWKRFTLEQVDAAIRQDCNSDIQYQTWYIDHRHCTHCFEPRTWRTNEAPFDWERQLRGLWYDMIDARRPLKIYMVSPHLRQHRDDDRTLGHLVLVQGSTDYVAVLLSSPAIHGLHERHMVIAASTFKRSEGQHLLRLAGMSRECDQLQCTLWLYPHRLPLRQPVELHDGAHIEIVPAFGPESAQEFHDGSTISDHVSWLQMSKYSTDLILNEHELPFRDCVPLSDQLAVSNCPASNSVETQTYDYKNAHSHPGAGTHDGHHATPWFGPDHYTRPQNSHPWNTGEYPEWTTELWQQLYVTQAEENRRGSYSIEVYTWFLDESANRRCDRDRPMQLGPEWWNWEQEIRHRWRDKIHPERRMNVHLVFPEPPRDTLELHQGQLLVEQIEDGSKATLISALFETTNSKRLWRAAFALPSSICKFDVLTRVPGIDPANSQDYSVFWHEHVFNEELYRVPHGAGIILHKGLDAQTWRRLEAPDTRRADEDDDVMNLMAHQINQEPEPIPIIDDRNLVRELDEPDDPEDTPEEHESSDSEPPDDPGYDIHIDPDTTWRSVIIFTRNREGIVGRAQETHPELCHREYAHMLSVTPNSLIQVHDIRHPPDDLAAAGQEAIIAQQLHDLEPGSLGRLILVDVVFCNHLPALDVETIRQVKILCSPVDREKILRLLRLARYSHRPGQACLIHLNGEIMPTQQASAVHLEHGDYLKITVPPAARHNFIDTRLAVLAHFHNMAEAAYPHLLRQVPENMDIMQVPNPAILLDNLEEADAVTLLHLMQYEASLRNVPYDQGDRQNMSFCELRATGEAQQQVIHHRQPLMNAPDRVPAALLDIFNSPAFLAEAALPEADGIRVQTWYLSHVRARRCNIPKAVHLEMDPGQWRERIQSAWNDEIDPDADVTFHTVTPQPYEIEQGITAHIIVKQHEIPYEIGVHVTIFDPGVREGRAVRFTAIHRQLISHYDILDMADRDQLCYRQGMTCRTWSGWNEITDFGHAEAFNGQSFALCVLRQNDPAHDPRAWDEFQIEGDSLLQLRASIIPTLQLNDLIPEPSAIVFVKPSGVHQGFPPFLEVSRNHSCTEVESELNNWGYSCKAIRFGEHDDYFCVFEPDIVDGNFVHYMYTNVDSNDKDGRFLHTSPFVMDEKDHMKMLHQLGYIRAALISNESHTEKVHQVLFCENWGAFADEQKKQYKPTWPKAMPISHQSTCPSQLLDTLAKYSPDCVLDLPGSIDDIRKLLSCSTDCITLSTDGLELPDYVYQAIGSSCAQSSFDRLIIYTDGSSHSNASRQVPDRGIDPDEIIDAWAFAVLGETYGPAGGPSKITFLGWHTQQVLYEPSSPHHVGAQYSGSHVAEREALLWAMIWRIGINSSIPTVFRPDSRVTGAQANGDCGTACQDYSFRMLRSTYQLLEAIIPGRLLLIDWTPGHCGDPWNELVDIAAKTESHRSFYMPRLSVDLRAWEDKWFHLWMVFDRQSGLPRATANGFDMQAPELPSLERQQADQPPTNTTSHKSLFWLSLATGNVNSLYTGPEGHAGKLNYLRAQFQTFRLNMIGLQESRAERCSSTQQQILRLAGGGNQGRFGVELWVNLAQPYGQVQGRPVLFREHHFTVVYTDPRLMLVKACTDHLQFWILVAHAPQSGQHAQARHEWWEALHRVLHAHLDGCPLYGLFDANSGCGLKDDLHVFSDGPATPNTDDFRSFLQEFDLYLPSTTSQHQGEDETWWSPDGQTSARIDYVVLPRATMDFCTYSQVLTDFDLGQLYDHRPVAAELHWCQTTEAATHRNRHSTAHYHRGQIAGHDLFKEIKIPEWSTNIEEHVEGFNAQVHQALHSHCRAGPTTAKKTYITQDLWELRTKKLKSRAQLKNSRAKIDRQLLRQCFAQWLSRTPPAEDDDIILQSCAQIKNLAIFHTSAKQLRKQLRRTKLDSLNSAFDSMPDRASSSYILQTVKEHSGPTNVKKLQKRPLPIIEDEQGQPCTSPAQALNRWIQFFCDMEGGERMASQDQRALWIANLQSFMEKSFHLEIQALPSLVELEAAYRRVSNGKATGPDGIPSEACRYNPAALAKATYAQLLKLMTHGQEHLSHKGGKLVKAWKGKGSQSTCSAYRSLLISNHTGKVIHRALRMHQSTLFEAFLQSQQIGGRRGVPVQLGLHLARSFQRWQLEQGNNHALLFLDLQEAFYRVLRPLALDCKMDDVQVAKLMQKLGLGPHAMHDLLAHLRQAPAVAAAKLHWTQRKAATAIHADTHFWMEHQQDQCVTHVGSRPGDCFADLIFSYAWGRILKQYEERLRELDILTFVPHQDSWSPFGHADAEYMTPFLGPCWMDDIVICITGQSCAALESKAGVAGSLLIEMCESHGMSPNLKPGKTEIMLVFKGEGSRKIKKHYYKPGETAPLPLVCEERICHLHVTGSYLHLGNILHHTGRSGIELKRRIAIGQQAFSQHRKLLFHNQRLTWERRKELFDTLVLSKILYGSETSQSIPDWKISIEIDFFNRKKSISKIQSRIHRFQSCDFQSIFQSNLLQNSIEFSIEFSIGNSIEKTCFYLGFLELSSLHVLCFLLFSRAIHPMCFFLLSGASQPTWAFAFSSQLQHSSRLSSGIPENL